MRTDVKLWAAGLAVLLLAVTGVSALHGHAANCDDCALSHAPCELLAPASAAAPLQPAATVEIEAPACERRPNRGSPCDRGPPAA